MKNIKSIQLKINKLRIFKYNFLRNNSKGIPSKIKEEGYYSAYKNNILIQKYEDKNNIYFETNYYISTDNLRNTNIKNRVIDTFSKFL